MTKSKLVSVAVISGTRERSRMHAVTARLTFYTRMGYGETAFRDVVRKLGLP